MALWFIDGIGVHTPYGTYEWSLVGAVAIGAYVVNKKFKVV